MLHDLHTDRLITEIPFRGEYDRYMARLDAAEIDAIERRLNEMIDGTEIQTAGWMPGGDWSGTVFQPIYEKAARGSVQQAALCFGLMVWTVFQHRPERWYSGRFEKDGQEIGSRTYFMARS